MGGLPYCCKILKCNFAYGSTYQNYTFYCLTSTTRNISHQNIFTFIFYFTASCKILSIVKKSAIFSSMEGHINIVSSYSLFKITKPIHIGNIPSNNSRL